MIGDSAFSSFIDKIFSEITNIFSYILNGALSAVFVNRIVALVIFLIIINIIAIVLMKKDKEYSQTPDARRIRESTLLITAILGGAYGEYYAMYKYKHKTLHKKFLYILPMSMVFHFSILAYNIFLGILS